VERCYWLVKGEITPEAKRVKIGVKAKRCRHGRYENTLTMKKRSLVVKM